MSSQASRFGTHFAALNAGALIVIAALSFRPAASAWITLGLASLGVLSGLTGFAMPKQGPAARTFEALLVLGGAWAILAARVFSDPHLTKWLCFANGVMIWTLGGLGLLAHELTIEGRPRRLLEDERYRRAMTRPLDPWRLTGQSETPR